jgi:hypothetical protein
VAGFCEHVDEPSVSGATELVSEHHVSFSRRTLLNGLIY